MKTVEMLFRNIGERHFDSMSKVRGVIRFDVADDCGNMYFWRLQISQGNIDVDSSSGRADCIVSTDMAAMRDIAEGKDHPMAMLIRGRLSVEGELGLFFILPRMIASDPTQATNTYEQARSE